MCSGPPAARTADPKEVAMALRTHGLHAVDWEQRIDYEALRNGRLARAKEYLERATSLLQGR